jgi:D-glycero-D-manno-heptose 1,7-bisphosphate phosphatase
MTDRQRAAHPGRTLACGAAQPGIFLDKDGTLLDDVPFNVDPARMRLAPGADEALRIFARLGLPVFIISNQSGVALGRFPPAALEPVDAALRALFAAHGATLTQSYFCPHHPGGSVPEFTHACACRKPAPGLLQRAAREHRTDLSASWFVGDILDDVEAGRRAGVSTILIDNGNETVWRHSPWREPHHLVPDMAEAARRIAFSLEHPGASAPATAVPPTRWQASGGMDVPPDAGDETDATTLARAHD